MGRQVHFVIAVDVDTQEVFIDDDTYTAKFDYTQGYWDTEEEAWNEDADRLMYDKALVLLNNKKLGQD